jgi:Acyl-protein synthetase, LuxE
MTAELATLDPAFFAEGAFSQDPARKRELLGNRLRDLDRFHRASCPAFGRWADARFPAPSDGEIASFPWVPVGAFKQQLLRSVPAEAIVRTLTSSGTTGSAVSQIPLDRTTADLQARALTSIIGVLTGGMRLPYLVIDHESTLRPGPGGLSARGAGVAGLMHLGRRPTWALNADLTPDVNAVKQFLGAHGDQPFLVFGFTFLVWAALVTDRSLLGADFSNAILIHSGGWKKLLDQAVSPAEFRSVIATTVGASHVHNFYGMAEQVGSVFLEGSDHLLHAPSCAEVVIRDPDTYEVVADGEIGAIEVLSALPGSYPGHAILTEDLGVIRRRDSVNWRGTAFEVLGRIPRAELRGCSNVIAEDLEQGTVR